LGQHELFYENFRGALAYAVKWLGGCAAVGKALWPGLSAKQAESKLSDCLSEDRATKLDLEEIAQILMMARERGLHCAMNQLCREAGYADPAIAPMKTKDQERAERMTAIVAEFKRLADEAAAELSR
jgi:hypothetical protein